MHLLNRTETNNHTHTEKHPYRICSVWRFSSCHIMSNDLHFPTGLKPSMASTCAWEKLLLSASWPTALHLDHPPAHRWGDWGNHHHRQLLFKFDQDYLHGGTHTHTCGSLRLSNKWDEQLRLCCPTGANKGRYIEFMYPHICTYVYCIQDCPDIHIFCSPCYKYTVLGWLPSCFLIPG